jgi:sulfofructose kinase
VKQVTCVGIAVLDLVFRVDSFPETPGKYRASERREVGGGVAATAAATVSSLGGRGVFVGCVGDDAEGERIVADLARYGVGTLGVRRVAGAQSPLSVVLVEASGERTIVNHASSGLFDEAAPLTESDLVGADAVLADMRWPSAAVVALDIARRRGLPAVLDCDHDPTDHPDVVAAASHAVFALPTLAAFVGAGDPEAALRAASGLTGGIVVATDGGNGVHWLDGDRYRHLPAFRVDVVDTLGAGDVFHGALALALAEGRPLESALRWASAAAAIKCTRFGGRAGIPARSEVDRFVEENA